MTAAIYARKSTDQNGVVADARLVTREIGHAGEDQTMTNADWRSRVIHARTQHDDLLPQRVWALRKNGHEATVDLRAVPGIGAEVVLSVITSCAERGGTARMNRRSSRTRSQPRGRRSKRRVDVGRQRQGLLVSMTVGLVVAAATAFVHFHSYSRLLGLESTVDTADRKSPRKSQ